MKENKSKDVSRIQKTKCPICHHGKMWSSRGLNNPVYVKKCCKCNYQR